MDLDAFKARLEEQVNDIIEVTEAEWVADELLVRGDGFEGFAITVEDFA